MAPSRAADLAPSLALVVGRPDIGKVRRHTAGTPSRTLAAVHRAHQVPRLRLHYPSVLPAPLKLASARDASAEPLAEAPARQHARQAADHHH